MRSWKNLTENKDPDGYPYSEMQVTLRRYMLEVETLCNQMEQYGQKRRDGDPSHSPIVFFDGSLVVSFALTMPGPYRERYIASAISLLQTSEQQRVPLIGYIDTSYARDMITMLRRLDTDGTSTGSARNEKYSRCFVVAGSITLGGSYSCNDLLLAVTFSKVMVPIANM